MDDDLAQQIGMLIDRYAGPLELYASQWTEDAADVVQDAFLRLVEQATFPADPAAWLYRVVRNAALNQARARQRRTRHEQFGAAQRPMFVHDVQTEGDLSSQEIHDALQGLAREEREVVIARLWGGLTLQQIADLTGCSPATVHRRFEAALSRLRMRLSQRWSLD